MSSKKLLAKNTFFLYILTFSTQLLNLITIPYQTRVLEPITYGVINVAVAVMLYVQLVLDFGFILSATALITKNRKNKEKLSQIHTAVVCTKVLLGILIFLILFVANFFLNFTSGENLMYLIYFIAYLFNALLPDYIYRGMENMKSIALRTLAIRTFFTCLIFVLVKEPNDYLFIPILLLTGNTFALGYSHLNINKLYSIKLVPIKIHEVTSIMKKSVPFFISRFASTFYQVLNTLIIGFMYNNTAVVGYYTSSDKLVGLSKSFSSPIADSLYPYMIKQRNFKIIKKILLFLMPLIFVAGIVTFIFAHDICALLFGDQYRESGTILRCLLPIAVIILPTYIFAFPVMEPMGIVKYANRSNVVGAILQITLLLILFLTSNITVYTLAICASIVEIVVFIYRVYIVIKNRHLMKEVSNEKN